MRALALILALAIAPSVISEEPARQDVLTEAAGDWVVDASSGSEGKGHVFLAMIGTPVTIHGDRLSWVEKWGVDADGNTNWVRVSRKLVTDRTVSPLAVEIVADGPYKAWSRTGILKLEGDELYLCVNFPQNSRPARFEPANDGRELVVLRRVQEADG